MNQNESASDIVGLRGLADWVRRSCAVLAADLELVDCGSVDVLLYCPDDLVMPGQGGPEIDRSGR